MNDEHVQGGGYGNAYGGASRGTSGGGVCSGATCTKKVSAVQ